MPHILLRIDKVKNNLVKINIPFDRDLPYTLQLEVRPGQSPIQADASFKSESENWGAI